MAGLITQTLLNLEVAEKLVAGITGLPANAVTIQSNASNMVNIITKEIIGIQKDVVTYAASAKKDIAAAQALIGSPSKNLKTNLANALKNIQNETDALNVKVTSASTAIKNSVNQSAGFSNALAKIELSFNGQLATLNGTLGTAKSNEKVNEKKYKYLLFLGPFGLVGLSVALGLYLKWKSNVNKCETQISSINAEISGIQTMVAKCKMLSKDLNNLTSKFSNIGNAVLFLSNESKTIVSDVGKPEFIDKAKLFLIGADAEVSTLAIDAS